MNVIVDFYEWVNAKFTQKLKKAKIPKTLRKQLNVKEYKISKIYKAKESADIKFHLNLHYFKRVKIS